MHASAARRWRHSGSARRRRCLLLFASAGLLAPPASSQEPAVPAAAAAETSGWRTLGSFRGSSSPRLVEQLNDFIFEQESGGDLYQDLGAVTLGLGVDFDNENGKLSWDNGMVRELLPLHADIPPGGRIRASDVSRYMEVNTLTSRGRGDWDYLPDVFERAGVGLRVEGGTSLTWARGHPPPHLGERPLREVLAELELRSIERRQQYPWYERSVLRLGVEGIAGLTGWIGRALAGTYADTERGAIFFESFADAFTLFLDLGMPVDAELFRAGDDLLAVGDRVRHLSFVGASPLRSDLRRFGAQASYQRFFRFSRETTLVKEEDDRVLVRVRSRVERGDELIPFKLRPEIRILGIVELGYTFFELFLDHARTLTVEVVYRVDLSSQRGFEALRSLTDGAPRVRFSHLARAAIERDGAEVLHSEVRRGGRRLGSRRLRLFSWLRLDHRRTSAVERLELDGEISFREAVRARSSRYRKKLGKERDWTKQFLVRTQGAIETRGGESGLTEESEHGSSQPLGTVAMTLLSGLRDGRSDGAAVRRAAAFIEQTLDLEQTHAVLEELANLDPQAETRLFANLEVSLAHHHLRRLASVSEEEVWAALGDIFLGPSGVDVWSTEEQRERWRRSPALRATSGTGRFDATSSVVLRVRDRPRPLRPRQRLALANRAAKRFRRLQRHLATGECLRCLVSIFDRWKDITLMQLLLVRLSRTPGQPDVGFEYEVFTDQMLQPVTVTNGLDYELGDRGRGEGAELGVGLEGDAAGRTAAVERRLEEQGRDWIGAKSFLDPSAPRLRGGRLLARAAGAEPTRSPRESPACLKLRIFSDHLFDADLRLRLDLRLWSGAGADRALAVRLLPLGAETPLVETPFTVARYSYDVALPALQELPELTAGRRYTLLVRVLNPSGLPVSEEQQVRFVWADDVELACGGKEDAPLDGELGGTSVVR